LLILDLTIPGGMGGKDTIDAIRKTGAQVPAIVCSGYSRDPVMANFSAYGFQAMITKPYQVSYLTETIQRFVRPAEKV
jgi:CheY-like chemotaxis protein